MKKKEAFRRLAQEVHKCSLCETLYSSPGYPKGDHLCHDKRVAPAVMNQWNLRTGNYDAKILILGQDFGIVDDHSLAFETQTDERLNYFLGADIGRCFFTNAACCYRQNKSSGPLNRVWLTLCVNRFLREELEILRPKVIIALGDAAFRSLNSCRCSRLVLPDGPSAASFSALVNSHQPAQLLLMSDGPSAAETQIPVFPVYHPSAKPINRSLAAQKTDWQCILDALSRSPL